MLSTSRLYLSVYSNSYCKQARLRHMPPEGYSVVMISEDVEEKLVRIMVNHDLESLGKAIEYAADEILVREDEITVRELVQMLSKCVI